MVHRKTIESRYDVQPNSEESKQIEAEINELGVTNWQLLSLELLRRIGGVLDRHQQHLELNAKTSCAPTPPHLSTHYQKPLAYLSKDTTLRAVIHIATNQIDGDASSAPQLDKEVEALRKQTSHVRFLFGQYRPSCWYW
jgi:hypothetical protein